MTNIVLFAKSEAKKSCFWSWSGKFFGSIIIFKVIMVTLYEITYLNYFINNIVSE